MSGKTFTNSSTVGATGTMTNRGTWTSTPTSSGKVTIPAGYHNGSGYVDTSSVYSAGQTTRPIQVHCSFVSNIYNSDRWPLIIKLNKAYSLLKGTIPYRYCNSTAPGYTQLCVVKNSSYTTVQQVHDGLKYSGSSGSCYISGIGSGT